MSDTLQEWEDQMDIDRIDQIESKNADWCDDCHGYTHMPWCPSYEPPETEANQLCPDGISSISAGSEHQLAAQGGGDEWQCKDNEVFIHRQMTPDELVKYRAKGFKTTDISYTIARFYGDDAKENAQRTIDAVNQHQSLVAERERLRRMLTTVIDAHYGINFYDIGSGDGIPKQQAEEIAEWWRLELCRLEQEYRQAHQKGPSE